MAIIRIPGGTATLRDQLVSERHFRVLEAAYMAAGPALKKVQEANADGEEADLDEAARAQLLASVPLTPAEATSLLELQDGAIVAFLERWSLSAPLPTIATVGDLDRETYKILAEATRGIAVESIQASQRATNFEPILPKTDPESGLDFPTGGSRPSDSLSRDEAETPLIATPLNVGGSTVTESFILG